MKHLKVLLIICLLSSCERKAHEKQLAPKNKIEVTNESVLEKKGIVYSSFNNGKSWSNISLGIPENVFVTDIAISEKKIGISTKQNGIFIYDFDTKKWNPIRSNKMTSSDIDAILFLGEYIYVGSRGEGVFFSIDNGENWKEISSGLENLTIRKLEEIDFKLYAGTNEGLYSLNNNKKVWEKEYSENNLQVNGITSFENDIFIGTNQGAYKKSSGEINWKLVFPNQSLHNISVANGIFYAMVYNELYASRDKGETWFNDQNGIPPSKYSFQVVESGNNILVGQWDGIYKKEIGLNWIKWNNGLPENIAITEMKSNDEILIAASSGWWIDKAKN